MPKQAASAGNLREGAAAAGQSMPWQTDPKTSRVRVSGTGQRGSGAHAASQMKASQLAMLLCRSCCETLKESHTRELLCAHKI